VIYRVLFGVNWLEYAPVTAHADNNRRDLVSTLQGIKFLINI